MADDNDWEGRVTAAWASFDEYDEPAFRALTGRLTAELPADDSGYERAAGSYARLLLPDGESGCGRGVSRFRSG